MIRKHCTKFGLLLVLAAAGCSGDATEPPATPALTLTLASPTAEITQAGTVAVAVSVTRTNVAGAVSITASGMNGVSAGALILTDAATSGTLLLTAAASAQPGSGTVVVTATGPNGTPVAAASLALTVNVRGSYTLALDPSTLSLATGATRTAAIMINRVNGFAGTVNLSATAPAGITATITPAAITGTTATLDVSAAATLAPGNYTVTVNGTSTGLALQTASLTVTVPMPALSVTLGSTTSEITQGGTVAVPVTVTRSNFTGAVSVSASGVNGVSAATLTIPDNATSGVLQLSATATATPGSGTLTVTATGPNGSPSASATLGLTVNVRGTYTLTLDPATLSIQQGTTRTAAITINRANNFAGPVNLTATAPAGITATITPTAVTGTTATLSVTAAPTAAPGNHTVTVNATTPGLAAQTAALTVTVVATSPPFGGTIFLDPDIITSADPTAFTGLTYAGQGTRTMFDRRVNNWITVNAFLFNATYDDGLTIEVQVNPEFGTSAASQIHAQRYAEVAGRLPTALRRDVRTMWIHQGVQPFGGGNNNLLIHVGQADLYAADGILEETLVHEASHTSLDASHATSSGWLAAQAADPTFISTYARDNPTREDIAESFLTWLAVRYRADRISASLRNTILTTIPNRLAYFDSLSLQLHPMR